MCCGTVEGVPVVSVVAKEGWIWWNQSWVDGVTMLES